MSYIFFYFVDIIIPMGTAVFVVFINIILVIWKYNSVVNIFRLIRNHQWKYIIAPEYLHKMLNVRNRRHGDDCIFIFPDNLFYNLTALQVAWWNCTGSGKFRQGGFIFRFFVLFLQLHHYLDVILRFIPHDFQAGIKMRHIKSVWNEHFGIYAVVGKPVKDIMPVVIFFMGKWWIPCSCDSELIAKNLPVHLFVKWNIRIRISHKDNASARSGIINRAGYCFILTHTLKIHISTASSFGLYPGIHFFRSAGKIVVLRIALATIAIGSSIAACSNVTSSGSSMRFFQVQIYNKKYITYLTWFSVCIVWRIWKVLILYKK